MHGFGGVTDFEAERMPGFSDSRLAANPKRLPQVPPQDVIELSRLGHKEVIGGRKIHGSDTTGDSAEAVPSLADHSGLRAAAVVVRSAGVQAIAANSIPPAVM